MKKIGILMNSIAEINFKKDSTLLLMSELQNQGKELYYIENLNLYFSNQTPMAVAQKIEVFMNENKWFDLEAVSYTHLTLPTS